MGTDAMILVFLNVSSQLFHSPLSPLSVSFETSQVCYIHLAQVCVPDNLFPHLPAESQEKWLILED